MASKQTYPCFQCRKSGFDNVMVYLDGRDSSGKTIYKNEDMTPHQHKQKQEQQQQQQASTTIMTEPTSLKIINTKLDRIIALLESQSQQQHDQQNNL